jgi:hypothetical protein
VLRVPAAARTACWLNAWLTGREPADEVIAGLTGTAPAVEFRDLDGPGSLSAALLLGHLRALGATGASAALPVPGDLVGLSGPAEFNTTAVDHGGAVVLHGCGLGLVGRETATVLTWAALPAEAPSYVPDVASADRDLRDAFRTVTAELVELDLAAWNPEVADALMNLRSPAQLDAPMAFAFPQAARTLISALRALEIVRLAERDDGAAVTATEAEERRRALAPLSHAGRVAVVAACSAVEPR